MKAALISWYGSGTNLLRSFLNSHPDIHFHKELFCIPAGWHPSQHAKGDCVRELEKAYNRDEQVVGVDIKYNQLNPEIERYLIENDAKIIHLLRDPLRTVWYKNSSVSEEKLRIHCNRIEDAKTKANNLFGDVLEITYEDMTRGREIDELPTDFADRIIEFLGVRKLPLELIPHHSTKPLKVRG